MEFASRGVGNTGLGLGIAGTALGLLNNGGLNLFGGRTTANEVASVVDTAHNMCKDYVTKDEFKLQQEISAKDMRIAVLESENFTNSKIADVYERLKADLNSSEKAQAAWNASQSVANAQMAAAIATNTNSIASLQSCCDKITKLVVPNTAICPGWGDVTIKPAG